MNNKHAQQETRIHRIQWRCIEALNVAEVATQDTDIYNPLDTTTGQPNKLVDTQENVYQNWW